MESLYFLIPLAMIILLVIVLFFFWAVRSGQMDDLEGPAYRILMDDDVQEKRTGRSSTKADDASEPPASGDKEIER